MKMFFLFFLSSFYFLFHPFVASVARADFSCQPIYGGGQTCTSSNNIVIDKKILNPQTNTMVDNLGINDPKYQPGFITTFQIKITNTGNKDFPKVEVKDTFPQYVEFSSGPGSFDANTKTLSFSLENLKVNESKTFTIMGRIVDESSIDTSKVSILTKVTLTNLDTKKQVTYQIVSEKEADLKAGKISITSPIGKGILGKKPGDTAEVQAPAGKINFKIEKITV